MSKNQNPRSAKPITAAQRAARQLLAENLETLIETRFPITKHGTRSASQMAFAKAAGLSWSTVQRVLTEKVSATTDTLVDMANVFHVSPGDLLEPNFADRYVERAELQRRPLPERA